MVLTIDGPVRGDSLHGSPSLFHFLAPVFVTANSANSSNGSSKDAILQVDIGEYKADSPKLVLCSKRCLAYPWVQGVQGHPQSWKLAKGQTGSDTDTVSLFYIACLSQVYYIV